MSMSKIIHENNNQEKNGREDKIFLFKRRKQYNIKKSKMYLMDWVSTWNFSLVVKPITQKGSMKMVSPCGKYINKQRVPI